MEARYRWDDAASSSSSAVQRHFISKNPLACFSTSLSLSCHMSLRFSSKRGRPQWADRWAHREENEGRGVVKELFSSLGQRMSNLRRDILGRLDPDGGIPLSRWQDSHLVQELVDTREQICSVFGLVRHVVKYLHTTLETSRKPKVHIQQQKKKKQCFFFFSSDLICHECGHGSANLMVLGTFPMWAQQQEEKPYMKEKRKMWNKQQLGITSSSVQTLHLVGTGTSVRPVMRTAGDSRKKAMMGFSRKSTSPTSTLEASAPGGIFFMKFMST